MRYQERFLELGQKFIMHIAILFGGILEAKIQRFTRSSFFWGETIFPPLRGDETSLTDELWRVLNKSSSVSQSLKEVFQNLSKS